MKYITQKKESEKPVIIHESKSSKLLDDEVMDTFAEENPWGLNVSINLYECDQKLIRDIKYIGSFIKELVAFIKMKAYGSIFIPMVNWNPRVISRMI